MQGNVSVSAITKIHGNNIEIYIFYNEHIPVCGGVPQDVTDDPDTLKAELLDVPLIQDGVPGIEGELMIATKEDVQYAMDINGNLLVSDTDSSKYSIDSDGYLIYDFCS